MKLAGLGIDFLRRLQRQAPSWLEQLPQLPEVVLENLQQSRDLDLRPVQQRVEETSDRGGELVHRRRRHLLAAVACLGAAVMAFPGGWELLAAAPLASWLLGGIAVVLLWPRSP